ncbi:unnamed protein product [Cuscuta campestris]|uniref:SANTA domain-containing protein n=1 Tax=Cuscuta campestris TaxID=132261 RepID=A0A484KCG6_9ASTE|nr:unnamed protein product [Cuscuta campestris]
MHSLKQVCQHFSIGFPHYWEEVVDQSFEQSKQTYALPKLSFNDDLPATFLRDFCVPEIYTTTNDLPVEIPQKMGSVSSRRSKISARKSGKQKR